MTDRMSVIEARGYITRMEERGHKDLTTLRAARTIVDQTEQIGRLQEALNEIEGWGIRAIEPITGVGILLPGDMEAPA